MNKRVAAALVAVLLCVGGGGTIALTQSSGPGPGYQTPYGTQAHSSTFGLPTPNTRLQALPARTAGTLEMYDSISVSAIPRSAIASAGYVSGHWPTFLYLFTKYKISIAVSVLHHAQCLDIEPGDATPSQAADWVLADIRAGYHTPCLYENQSQLPAVLANLKAAHIDRSRVLIWLALWTFHPGIVPGVDAQQWTDHGPHGENYDESTVTPKFLGIKPTPPPPPPPVLSQCFAHRITKAQCDQVKAQAKAAQRGAQQSLDAYLARKCDVLKSREHWFADKISHDHSAFGKKRLAYRRGALATTKKVERRQQCGLFAGRVTYFDQLETNIEKAN